MMTTKEKDIADAGHELHSDSSSPTKCPSPAKAPRNDSGVGGWLERRSAETARVKGLSLFRRQNDPQLLAAKQVALKAIMAFSFFAHIIEEGMKGEATVALKNVSEPPPKKTGIPHRRRARRNATEYG